MLIKCSLIFPQKLECKGFQIQQQSLNVQRVNFASGCGHNGSINEAAQSCGRVPKIPTALTALNHRQAPHPTTIKMFQSIISTKMKSCKFLARGHSRLVHKVVETFLRLLMKIINFRLWFREGGNFSN